MVFKKSLSALLINISVGLILTLMTIKDLIIFTLNLIFAIISFKLAVDLENSIQKHVRSHGKF